jgi:hypothetical protein
VFDIERAAPARTLQFGGEFDALGLSAREFRCQLSQAQIVQPDLTQQSSGRSTAGSVANSVQSPQRQHGHVRDAIVQPQIADDLTARKDPYWPIVVNAQRSAILAWVALAEGRSVEALRLAREAADMEERVVSRN